MPRGEGASDATVRSRDGLGLAVYEWGNPDGPEILLIHGQAQCHLSFEPQTSSFLARHYRLVAFDLRGHGGSDKPLDAEAYQDGRRWADDVRSVMDARGLHRPVLVGWSLGGRVIRQYLMHYGDERLSGINFVSCRPIEDPSVVGPGSAAIARIKELGLSERLQAEIRFLRDCFEKEPDEDELRLAIAYNCMVPWPVRDAIGGWSTDPTETRAALAKVRVPTLITHGRLDRLILPPAAEMTAEAVKHARISWYEECGHSPFYEDAPRFNDELHAFMAETKHDKPNR